MSGNYPEGGSGQSWVEQNVPIIFCQNLLFMAQGVRKWNSIRGSPCSIFQKMGQNIAIFDLFKYGVTGKTVTCLPLGSNFDNFQNYKFCNFLSQDSLWTIERD